MDDRLDGIKSGITKDQRASHLKDMSLRCRDDPLSTPRSRFPSLVGQHFISVASSLKRSSNPRRRREYIYKCVRVYI